MLGVPLRCRNLDMVVTTVQRRCLAPSIWGTVCHRYPRWVVWQVAAFVSLIGHLPTCSAATPATACTNCGGMIQFEDVGQPAPGEASLGPVFRMEDRGADPRSVSVFGNRQQPQMTISPPTCEPIGQGELVPSMSSNAPIVKARSFAPYVKLYAFDWQEHIQSARLLEEFGALYAVGYRLESFLPDDSLFGNLHPRFVGEVFGGSVYYDGQTQLGEPVFATTDYFGVRLDLTLHLPTDTECQNNFYFALGSQMWSRKLASVYGNPGYTEGWFTIYPRIGYEVRCSANNGWEGFADISLGVTAFTWESAALGDTHFDLHPKAGPVFGLEIGLRWRRMFVSTDLMVMSWRQSDVGELGVGQPDSQMVRVGLSAGVVF